MRRLELKINDDLANDLEKFAQESETSKSEIFRRAMTLFAAAREAKKRGQGVAFVNQEGAVVREVVGL